MRSPKSWSATLDCPKWKAKETWCLQRVGPQAMSVRTLRVYFPICQPDRLSLAFEPGTCLCFPWGRNKKIERHWNKLKGMWFSLKPSPEILFDLGVSLHGGQELIWVSSLFLRPEIQHMYLCFQIFTVTRWDSSKAQTHTKHLNADISTDRKKRLIRGVWFKPWPSHSLGLSANPDLSWRSQELKIFPTIRTPDPLSQTQQNAEKVVADLSTQIQRILFHLLGAWRKAIGAVYEVRLHLQDCIHSSSKCILRCLLCARCCPRHWGEDCEWDGASALMELMF